MTQRYFATTIPGLEQPLLDEVRRLGGKKPKVLHGGVEFDTTNGGFYRSQLEFRCANKVLLRVDEFRARDAPELYNKTRRFGWERLLDESNRVYVRGAASKSRLMHTVLIAETVRDGIRDHFDEDLGGKPPAIQVEHAEDALELLARLDDNRCELSLDGSGELLFKRGWREANVPAPIRETTAATLLHLSGWEPGTPILDPMCGGGTFVIEAARMTRKIPPGLDRDFAFHRWANFRPELWEEVRESAQAEIRDGESVHFGSDTSDDAIEASRHNAAAGRVSEVCSFRKADVSELEPPCEEAGLVIANPPYGERLESASEISNLLDVFESRFTGWRLALVLPASFEPAHEALEFDHLASFPNGGIPVRFWGGRFRSA